MVFKINVNFTEDTIQPLLKKGDPLDIVKKNQ